MYPIFQKQAPYLKWLELLPIRIFIFGVLIKTKLAGIYIHIPFCKQACHYCDFHFSTNLDKMEQMTQMICRELELRKGYLQGSPVETVYFGGGTPSLLSSSMLHQILDTIARFYNCNWKEVTLEANPDDLGGNHLSDWKSLGIDRLSLGIQSFDEQILSYYNRAHTAEDSQKAIKKARKFGFEKFSLDLIYGFPAPDHSLWKNDLSKALAQETGHISSYSLTVEPKTALGNWAKSGKFMAADEEFVAEQFEYLQEQTEKAGYIQYEVSNFGKPGQFALHNTNYWKGIPYLGVGPSAHSYDGQARGSNPAHNARFINQLLEGQIPFELEPLSEVDRLHEYLLTGLRTMWGIDFGYISDEFKIDLRKNKSQILAQMNAQGWLKWEENTLSLTRSGKLLADSIAASLFV